MKIDKISISLTNYGIDDRTKVVFYRGLFAREYYPTGDSVMRLMPYLRGKHLTIVSFGTCHLRIAVFPNKEEPYEPPF